MRRVELLDRHGAELPPLRAAPIDDRMIHTNRGPQAERNLLPIEIAVGLLEPGSGVLKEVAAQSLPQGYGYEFSGLSREEVKAGSTTVFIFAISIVFVFLFLAALYESWSVPFSVLFAVPIGAFGSIVTLTFLPNLNNNIYAQIGLITLIGLSAKNAILIVEFAKERVDRGMDILQATLEAVHLRLRPIVMTSLAFIFGVLPLAFATGAGAEARKTIGWTVAGGMLAATTLAIFVVPVLFVLIIKLSYGKKLKRLQEQRRDTEENKTTAPA